MGIGKKPVPSTPATPVVPSVTFSPISEARNTFFNVGGTKFKLKNAIVQSAFMNGEPVLVISSFNKTVEYCADKLHDIFFHGLNGEISLADGATKRDSLQLDAVHPAPLMFSAETEFETLGLYKNQIKYDLEIEDEPIKLTIRSWIFGSDVQANAQSKLKKEPAMTTRGFNPVATYEVKQTDDYLVCIDEVKTIYLQTMKKLSFTDL